VTERWEQPEPARPVAARSVSQMSSREFAKFLSAQEKANTATPGLQSALTVVPVLVVLATIAGLVIFTASHFRWMDVRYGVDAAGNHIGSRGDVNAMGMTALAVIGALLALVGARFDVTERTRIILMSSASAVMIVGGSCLALFLDPSRGDLQRHYHVGSWGSQASFAALLHTLDAIGWVVGVCGVAILVLMLLQRHRVAAAYPQ
jgi:hypothetical protein